MPWVVVVMGTLLSLSALTVMAFAISAQRLLGISACVCVGGVVYVFLPP